MSELIAVPTADLTGLALDWAVAQAANEPIHLIPANEEWGTVAELEAENWRDRIGDKMRWSPSTDYSQGAPLLGTCHISVVWLDGRWCAFYPGGRTRATSSYTSSYIDVDSGDADADGPSMLIAVCRAVVDLKLGSVVAVPAELLKAASPLPGGAQ